VTLDDYKLLEEMNKLTTNKYKELSQITFNVSKNVDQMNDKYKTLLPNLQLIDKLEEKVTKLEEMAYAIDAYSKRLGLTLTYIYLFHLLSVQKFFSFLINLYFFFLDLSIDSFLFE
jgi:hypothetical protein